MSGTRTVQERLRDDHHGMDAKTLKPAPLRICLEAAERLDALECPFGAADNGDWRALDLLLGHSAHGQFWRGVFNQFRSTLHPSEEQAQAGR